MVEKEVVVEAERRLIKLVQVVVVLEDIDRRLWDNHPVVELVQSRHYR